MLLLVHELYEDNCKHETKHEPADAPIQKLNWPTIAETIKRKTANSDHGLQVFKWSHSDVSLKYFFSRNSTRNTANLSNSETGLRVPLFKMANVQTSFAYCGTHLWSSLESEVKQSLSILLIKYRF